MRHEQAAALLKQYGIERPAIAELKHSENMTYKVSDPASGADYLLRIHRPATANLAGAQHTRAGLRSELRLLAELARNTELAVQTPVSSLSGSLITETEEGGRASLCSLLKWIEGRELKKEDLADERLSRELGSLTAKLHAFTRGCAGVRPEDRPEYGEARIGLMLTQISRGVDKGLFGREELGIVESSMRFMNGQLAETLNGPGNWGIIHADLNSSNILVTPAGELAFIDYGLFGYGYYMHDLAMAALNAPADRRRDVVAGYFGEGKAPNRAESVLGGFMLMAVLGYYAFQMENEKIHPWIRERMPKLCAERCRPFLNGEPIFHLF
ncbi:phosphotransferase enzyme family protein [Paenibacillus arenilitoris]|uniref:Phosphotransferase n=1 Tax=Paenibacillus arenilitoris TaxID=2772299 RepID=A0A927CPP5_9BACL|nr:phosphotransferase [Paenibacillus arenilitoris]MBD2869425.1 phosphotransferase [Paenibacillus arenilitoris]